MIDPPPTPELDKMNEARKLYGTQQIGEFLEWCSAHGYHLAEWKTFSDLKDPILGYTGKSTEQILAEYGEVDLLKAELEKRKLLEWHRKTQGGDD